MSKRTSSCFISVMLIAALLLSNCGALRPATAATPTTAARFAVATTAPTPTPTPEPTAAPAPSPTPTPNPRSDYLAQVQSQKDTLVASLTRVASLSETAGGNPAVMTDPTWRAQMLDEIAVWQRTAQEADRLVPPPGLETINAGWVAATTQLAAAGAELTRGVQLYSVTDVETASAQIQAATATVGQLAQQLLAYEQAHPGDIPPGSPTP